LLDYLDIFRLRLGGPVVVFSAFRASYLNSKVGGKPNINQELILNGIIARTELNFCMKKALFFRASGFFRNN
jgi:hypothetical protein